VQVLKNPLITAPLDALFSLAPSSIVLAGTVLGSMILLLEDERKRVNEMGYCPIFVDYHVLAVLCCRQQEDWKHDKIQTTSL
jgi:hypothetical protein